MIEIIGLLRNKRIRRVFDCPIDAIEFREILDAQYAKVTWNYL